MKKTEVVNTKKMKLNNNKDVKYFQLMLNNKELHKKKQGKNFCHKRKVFSEFFWLFMKVLVCMWSGKRKLVE